jgi:ornithine carbamoyltransferase
LGREPERRRRLRDLSPYQVNFELINLAKRDAIFLHCLPAHRGEEVTADVIDGSQSVVWLQVANHAQTEQALVYWLIAASLPAGGDESADPAVR